MRVTSGRGQEGLSRQRVKRKKHFVQCDYIFLQSRWWQEGSSKGVMVEEGWWVSGQREMKVPPHCRGRLGKAHRGQGLGRNLLSGKLDKCVGLQEED